MTFTNTLVTAVALACVTAFALSPAQAQNKPAGKSAPGKNAKPRKDLAAQEALVTEQMLGKTLTATQKADLLKAIRTRKAAEKASRDTYFAQLSKAVGVPVETLKKRAKEALDAKRAMQKMQMDKTKVGATH